MRHSRRSFLTSALLGSAALAAGCGSSETASLTPNLNGFTPDPLPARVDVAILGAGAAGIGAGRVLAAQNRSFTILEARNRIGGRCFCDNTTFPGIAFDVGGQWFHQVTPLGPNSSTNPLYDIAVASGLRPTVDDNTRLLFQPGQAPVDILDTEAVTTLAAVGAAGVAAGAAAFAGLAPDMSLAAASASLRNAPFYDIVTGLLIPGAPIDQLSTQDMFPLGFTGSPVLIPTVDNFLLESGMGNFLASLATGLPISLNTFVDRIRWGAEGVTLTTSRGEVQARSVIMTLPMGVLNSGQVQFSPALPQDYRSAMAGIRMTEVTKVGLLYDGPVFTGIAEPNTFAIPTANQQPPMFMSTRTWGKNYAIVIAGGPGIAARERDGTLVDYAANAVNAIFPQATRARLVAGSASSWTTDPLSLGSFSFATHGNQPGREFLARPLANQLFFAGEAISVDNHSSIHGAFISGQEAANRVLAVRAG